jgi:hypothetical protein
MPKLKPILFFIMLVFCWAGVSAQDSEKYLTKLQKQYEFAPTYTDQLIEYYLRVDTLALLNINSAATLQQFITKGAGNKIYAVEIGATLTEELNKIFSLLIKFPNLQYLKFNGVYNTSANGIVRLPGSIKSLQQLRSIEFHSTNKIDMVDALTKLSALKNLSALLFTGYRHELPSNILVLSRVTTLRLSTLNIGKLNISKANWQSVYITKDSPQSVDDQKSLLALSKITSLRKLEISQATPTDAAMIDKFRQITTLSISGENIDVSDLIKTIGQLTQLKTLLLKFWKSNGISIKEIKALSGLTSLCISNQVSQTLSVSDLELLSEFKKLETLSLYYCDLTSVPDIFDDLKSLKSLTLSHNKLTELPGSVFNLPLLEYLNVSFNDLAQLPAVNCYTCNNLKTLNMSRNELKELPNAITSLIQLEYFLASENYLTSLPGGWQNLKKLKYFEATDNEITEFPGGLQDNHTVEAILLTVNKISYFPDITGSGYRVKSLEVDINPLAALPEHIGKYTELERLFASKSKITSLPQTLSDCKRLRHVVINANVTYPKLPDGARIISGN